MKADAALDRLLPGGAGPRAFPDGADFRIEIPSVEGPRVLDAVIAAAAEEGVVVNRVSQGSGAMLLREEELREMASLGAEHGIEVSLFVGPRESYDITAHARTEDGAGHGGQLRGLHGLRYAVEDIARAVECGIRSFLMPDIGLLALVNELQRAGELPPSVVWKISVMLAPSNPLALRELERIGASTVNVPSDMSVDTLREMRAATTLPIDLYVESPDALGGVVRGNELGDLVRAGAPLYAKFGLRNSRMLYPVGPPPRGRGLRDRTREGASRRGRAGVVQPLEPWSGAVGAGRGGPWSTAAGNGRVGQMTANKGGTVRRIISGCAAFVALVVIAGAAYAAGGSSRGSVTLTLWHNYGTGGNAVATKNLVAAFEKKNPSIKINVVSQPGSNYFQLLQAAWIAHTAPDLSVQWTGLFDTKYENQLLNLKQYFTTAELSKVSGAKWASSNFDPAQGLLVMPLENQFYMGFYNKALFKKAGVMTVPTDWSQLFAACTKLKAAGITPIVYGADPQAIGPNPYPYYDLSYIAAGLYSPAQLKGLYTGQISWTSPALVKQVDDMGFDAEAGVHEQRRADEDEHPRRLHEGAGGHDHRRQLGHRDAAPGVGGEGRAVPATVHQQAAERGRAVLG